MRQSRAEAYGNTKTLERRIAQSKVSSSINTAFVERSNLTLRQHDEMDEKR